MARPSSRSFRPRAPRTMVQTAMTKRTKTPTLIRISTTPPMMAATAANRVRCWKMKWLRARGSAGGALRHIRSRPIAAATPKVGTANRIRA
ncbi:hypothetical protein D3C80_1865180 [compost metagenome]